jgi:hypothetical protein
LLHRPSVAIGLPALAALLVCALLLGATPRTTPAGDAAMTELYTLHASQGVWPYGPYSRFGWHHPGPLLFYLYAPWYRLAAFHSSAINGSAVLVNVIAVASVVWLIVRCGGGALAWSVLGALGLFVWRFGGVISSAWNPHALILPLTSAVMFTAAAAAGEAAVLAAWVIAASLVVQSHAGLAPVVAVLAAFMVPALIWQRYRPGFRRHLAWAAALAAIVWALPIAEGIGGRPGNVLLLYRFFASAAPVATGMAAPLATWADLTTVMWSADPLLQSGEHYQPVGGTVALVIAAGQWLLLAPIAWWAFRTGRRLLGWLCVLVAVTSMASLYALHRQWQIEGAILVHTSLWIEVIGLLNLAAVAAAALSLAAPHVSPALSRRAGAATGAAGAIALALLAIWSGYQFERLRQNVLRGQRHPADTDRLVENTARFVRERGISHPLLIVEAPVWHHTAAVVLDLARSGVDVSVQPELRSMFGAGLVRDTPRDAEIRIIDEPRRAEVEREPGQQLVISRGPVHVYARMFTSRAP